MVIDMDVQIQFKEFLSQNKWAKDMPFNTWYESIYLQKNKKVCPDSLKDQEAFINCDFRDSTVSNSN